MMPFTAELVREVFRLRTVCDKTPAEIAEITGIEAWRIARMLGVA